MNKSGKRQLQKSIKRMKKQVRKYEKKFPKQLDHLILAAFFLLVLAAAVSEVIARKK